MSITLAKWQDVDNIHCFHYISQCILSFTLINNHYSMKTPRLVTLQTIWHQRFSQFVVFDGKRTNCESHGGILAYGLLARDWSHNPHREEKDSNLCIFVYLIFIFFVLKRKKKEKKTWLTQALFLISEVSRCGLSRETSPDPGRICLEGDLHNWRWPLPAALRAGWGISVIRACACAALGHSQMKSARCVKIYNCNGIQANSRVINGSCCWYCI